MSTCAAGQVEVWVDPPYPWAWLPSDLPAHMDSEEVEDLLRNSHERGMSQVGTGVGAPVLPFDGVAFLGPVVTPAPRGEEAGRLWDGCVLVAGTPGFVELKRTRDQDPHFG